MHRQVFPEGLPVRAAVVLGLVLGVGPVGTSSGHAQGLTMNFMGGWGEATGYQLGVGGDFGVEFPFFGSYERTILLGARLLYHTGGVVGQADIDGVIQDVSTDMFYAGAMGTLLVLPRPLFVTVSATIGAAWTDVRLEQGNRVQGVVSNASSFAWSPGAFVGLPMEDDQLIIGVEARYWMIVNYQDSFALYLVVSLRFREW